MSVHGKIYLVAARVAQQNLRSWRNWQTRTVQVRVVAIPWRFESSRPHQPYHETLHQKGFSFFNCH